tara:strand:+ start:1185 stop:2108 length:924 start_codon:yes stop_codon:yes gene_type:complete
MKKKTLIKKTLIGKQDYKISNFNQEWVLYHNEFSLCSRKVRVCLEELGDAYYASHIHLIETKDCENLSKDFLKINPKATVPVLLHNNYPIYESHEQIKYISELNPDKFGKSEIINKWYKKGSLVGDDPLTGIHEYAGNCVSILTQPLFIAMLKKINYLKFFKYILKHPSKFRSIYFLLFKVIGYAILKKNSPSQKAATKAYRFLKIHLENLNSQLDNKKWIDGNQFSIADITWMVVFHRLEELQILEPLISDLVHLNNYYERLKERNSFKNQISNNQSNSVSIGINELKSDLNKNKHLIAYLKLLSE